MKKILILFFITIPVFNAYAGHTPEHTEGDNIDYESNKNMNELKYNFPDSYAHKEINYLHLYGYFSSTYTHEENPYCYSDETLQLFRAEQEDDYSLNRLYLTNAFEISDSMVWNTVFYGAYRFYNEYKRLNDFYSNVQTGPSFLFSDKKTSLTTKVSYSGEHVDDGRLFNSIGGTLRLNHVFLKNFNITLNYEVEKRNYNAGNTDETDRYIHSIFFANRFYLYKRHIFKFMPLYKYYETQQEYQDKNLFGFAASYTYYSKYTNFYIGAGYEELRTFYNAPYPGETYKKEITEKEYSLYLGYAFYKDLSLELSYGNKKLQSNQPETLIDCLDESFSATIVYKFHLV